MSVDTYARKTDYSAYRTVREHDFELLIAKSLMSQATQIQLELRRFLMFKWLSVRAELHGHET